MGLQQRGDGATMEEAAETEREVKMERHGSQRKKQSKAEVVGRRLDRRRLFSREETRREVEARPTSPRAGGTERLWRNDKGIKLHAKAKKERGR